VKLLLDTCVLIPAEPTDAAEIEPETEIIALLQRACQQIGYQTYVHPCSLEELARNKQSDRRLAREMLMQRYLTLERPPDISSHLELLVGTAVPGSHDEADNKLLMAVFADAVDFLVTSDDRLLKKAIRANIGERVGRPTDILKKLEGRLPRKAPSRPGVESVRSYELDEHDPIFAPFRSDYPDFNIWFPKCKLEHRPAWLIRRADKSYAAICIVKHEEPGAYDLPGKVLKVCSFRVDPHEYGRGYGELLLKAIFDYAFLNAFDCMYVEVYPHHGDVIRLLSRFGFADKGILSGKGERVLIKMIACTPTDRDALTPLDYNLLCGPQRVRLEGARAFIVPIRPKYHSWLFPEVGDQRDLFAGHFPFGNAIRKAYLCHARLKNIPPGAILLFYLSRRRQRVYCIGVAEKSVRSNDPQEILNLVGTRTVYSVLEIEAMCKKEVLAILFRHAFTLEPEWTLEQLVEAAVLRSYPQSIVEVPQEAHAWLKTKLQEWL
jgi:GNAT superfamily N-acetyltransferase/predicted nucleic acid-binding protein